MGSDIVVAVLGKPEEVWATFNGLDHSLYVNQDAGQAAVTVSMGKADQSVLDPELHRAGGQDGQANEGKTQEVLGLKDAKGHPKGSGAGQAAGEHGEERFEQKVGPKRMLDSIKLIEKQVKEKEAILRQKQHEIHLIMEK